MKKSFRVQIDKGGNMSTGISQQALKFYAYLREIAGNEAVITVETIEKPLKCEHSGCAERAALTIRRHCNTQGKHWCLEHAWEGLPDTADYRVERLPVAPVEAHGTEFQEVQRLVTRGESHRCIEIPEEVPERYVWSIRGRE